MGQGRQGGSAARAAGLRALPIAAVAALALLLAGASAYARPAARSARTISINDSASLHLTSHHGFTLNEEGNASGTIGGKIYIHLHVVSTNEVTAEVNIYPHGGSVTGSARAGYHPAGALARFNGTINVTRGTGAYNGAHGSGLTFTGTVARSNDAVTVHVSGRMSS
jgi:hypothetical protein